MVIVKVAKHKFYMDGYLKSNLDAIKKIARKDWDWVFIVDGTEGGGKSTFCIQMALYCDPTFTLDRVVFDPVSFEKAVINADKYTSVVYDEAITGMYSREAMQFINITLTKLLAQIRQKNLFIFIVIPTFFDLDKYISMWRARGLFHIYTKDFTRGYFLFYNQDKKKNLWVKGKKYYAYWVEKPNFKGKYTSYNPFLKEYKKKKYESLKNREGHQTNVVKQRDKLIQFMYESLGITQKEIGRICGLNQTAISFTVEKLKKASVGKVINKKQSNLIENNTREKIKA